MILGKKFAFPEHGQSATNTGGLYGTETQVNENSVLIFPIICMLGN